MATVSAWGCVKDCPSSREGKRCEWVMASYNCKYASDSHVMVTVLGAGVTIWEPRPDDLLAGVLLKLSTKGP